jgi:hypothetical protein
MSPNAKHIIEGTAHGMSIVAAIEPTLLSQLACSLVPFATSTAAHFIGH